MRNIYRSVGSKVTVTPVRMIMTGMTGLFCLICNTAVDESTRVNICGSYLHNGESLESFVQRVLRSRTSELGSSYVCMQCHNLFQMLERAQFTVKSICCEILKVYLRSKRERAVERQLRGKDQYPAIDLNERSEAVADDMVNPTDLILYSKSINDEIDIALQNFSENTTFDQNLSVLNMDAIVDINASNVAKDIDVKRNQISCFNKEDAFCRTTRDDAEFISSSINDDNVTRMADYSKPLDFNVDILDRSLNNSTMLSGTHNTSNNNAGVRQQRDAFHTRQLKRCIELIKSHNESHIHVLRYEGSQEYQDLENRIKACNLPEMNGIDGYIDTVAKNDIKATDLPQNNQTQNFSQTREIDANIKIEVHAENSFVSGKNANDCNNVNVNTRIESYCASTSEESQKTSQRDSKSLQYTCTTCGKMWKTLAELRTHTKRHSTLRPYMCEKCGQAYKHKHALEVHVGMHNGINPFQCNYCNKCFTQKGALMRHLPIHTGETPYQCELCGKRFVHHTSYNMHALSHTGKKSYQCNVCDLFLLSTSHLKRHMRVHTGEKPYSCNLCGKRFAERYNLFAHRKIHDPDEIMMREKKRAEKSVRYRSDEEKFIGCISSAQISDSHTLHTQNQTVNMRKANFSSNAKEQMWLESDSQVRSHNIDDRAKLVSLENSLPCIDANSLVTFNNQNFPV